MKKFLGIVVCCTLLFSLSACGQEAQVGTGPFRVTPISGFAFEEEGDTIYIPEIDIVGDEFSLGTDTGATVMIQGMEMHDGKLTLFFPEMKLLRSMRRNSSIRSTLYIRKFRAT